MKKKLFFLVIASLFMIANHLSAQTAYAVYCEGDKSLHFLCCSETLSIGETLSSNGKVITSLWSGDEVTNTGDSEPGWQGNIYNITNVVFEESFKTARPQSCHEWFFKGETIKTINGLKNLNTSNVTDMSFMFCLCLNLTNLDLNNFNTSNVTNMAAMFYACNKLKSLNLSNFDTSNVTNMAAMFFACIKFQSLNLSNFDTSNVTDMSEMFGNAYELTSLNLSNFDTSNVKNMSYMFNSCKSLSTINLKNFNTSSVTDMKGMFNDCYSLTNLDLTKFDTSNVTDITKIFYGCTDLKTLDLSGLNMLNITDMKDMFSSCRSLTTLKLNNLKTSNVKNMSRMFADCNNLTTLELSGFNTLSVTDMSEMFDDCQNLTSLDLSNFDTSNVRDMRGMFAGCGITTLDLSSFNTSSVTNMSKMFDNCQNLTTINLSSFNTSLVQDMSWMFSSCLSLTTLDLSHFNTLNVTDMSGMFCNCASLTALDLSNFNTLNVTDINYMFNGCEGLTTLTLNFDMSNVKKMDYMFSDNLVFLDMSKAKMPKYNFWSDDAISEITLTYVPEGTSVPKDRVNVVVGNKCNHFKIYINDYRQHLLSISYEFTAAKITVNNKDFIADRPYTLYLPFEMSSTAYGNFYTYGSYNESDGTVIFNKVTAANTTANTPYLFKPNKDGIIEIEDKTLVKQTAKQEAETIGLNGVYEYKIFTEEEINKGIYHEWHSFFLNGKETNVFFKVYSQSYTGVCQAYLMLPYNHNDDYLSIICNEGTGINSSLVDSNAPQTPTYNINGQRVDRNYKGIVIRNGKKMMNHAR